ncbi:MAG: site-specific integrase [Bacillota bacterium]
MNVQKRVPQALNNYEQLALLRQPNLRAPTGLRNLCIISLMLKAGLRVNEVINLNEADLDWEQGKIHIKSSRTAKGRTLLLEDGDLAMLKRWQEIKPAESSYLLTSLNGNRLKDRYLREMIKRLSRKAGIGKDVYPHLLRYTFAVNLMRETKNIRLLQQALGHRDQTATQMYINLLFNELADPDFSPAGGVRSGMPVTGEGEKANQQADSNCYYMEDMREETNINGKKEHFENFVHFNEHKNGSTEHFDHTRQNSDTAKNKSDSCHNKETESSDFNEENPEINIEAESGFEDGTKNSKDKKPIPPMKCSKCDYILSYQDDCPKCGTAFSEIVKHWRRNLW